MALEMVEMVEMADGWADFVIEDRDMQLLWDIYRQPQAIGKLRIL